MDVFLDLCLCVLLVPDRAPSPIVGRMRRLSHENLEVYQKAVEFLGIAAGLLDRMPKGHKTLVDQLRRASLSILLNIAEAAGKVSPAERRHHFAIARGSALECGAGLDATRLLGLGDDEIIAKGKDVLVSVVAMLSKMCRAPDGLSASNGGPCQGSASQGSVAPASRSESQVGGIPSASPRTFR